MEENTAEVPLEEVTPIPILNCDWLLQTYVSWANRADSSIMPIKLYSITMEIEVAVINNIEIFRKLLFFVCIFDLTFIFYH